MEEKGTYLLNRYSIPVMAGIFLIATIGVSTAIIESVRMNNWRKDMNWLPGPDTYIYPLNAGELSEKIFVNDKCYRMRAYPHQNVISTFVARQGKPTIIPNTCNTSSCPHRYFKLKESGYLFMEKVSNRSKSACQKLLAGWLPHELPRGQSLFENANKTASNQVPATSNTSIKQPVQNSRPKLRPWKYYKIKNFLTAARFTINSNECFEFEATKIPIGGTLEIKIPAENGRQQKMNRGVVTGPATFDIKYENFIGKATFRYRGWNKLNGKCG